MHTTGRKMFLTIMLAVSIACLITKGETAARTVHFIAGPPSHGKGMHEHVQGCDVLAAALVASGLDITALVHTNEVPTLEELRGAASIVIFSDGGETLHVARRRVADLRSLWEGGCGIVVLHYALTPSSPEMAALWTDALGGYYELHWSVNPIWTPRAPVLADHPVTRGVQPFELEDEWYYHMRFREGMQDVTPILSAVPPPETVSATDGPHSGNPTVRTAVARKDLQHVAWVSEDATGRRGFGFTGGHFHTLWSHDDARKLVMNGIAWTAGVDIPAQGVSSSSPIIPRRESLVQAAALDDAEDVRRHIRAGANVNAQNQTGWTALHHAAVRNKRGSAEALLDNGADPNLQTNSGKTPLHFCGERGFIELAQLLIARGAKPEARDQEGWTPLHYAAERDKSGVARLLISSGADPNALSARGGTPLHEAAASAGSDMIQLLLDGGANPDIRAANGKVPLDYAVELGNTAARQVLQPPQGNSVPPTAQP